MNRFNEDNADLLHDQRAQEALDGRLEISRKIYGKFRLMSRREKEAFMAELLVQWTGSNLKLDRYLEAKANEKD